MKTIYHVIIPVIAFLVILTNAFFGHLIFASETQQVIHKYTVYVHLLSEWDSDSKNIIFDVTNSWYNPDKENNANHMLNVELKRYNTNQLQTIHDKSYVELNHGLNDCKKEWQPMLYRKAVDTLRNEIEFFQGKQLILNPVVPMYLSIENKSYDKDEQQLKIKDGFSQFIPICTSKENTSYDYSIKTDSNNVGFDVYFVLSQDQQNNFHDFQNNFEFYTADGCYAKNKKSFSGTCDDIGKNSGLLIIIPDELDKPLTKVSVGLKENGVSEN